MAVSHDHLTNLSDLFAGNAVFTVVSGEERYTFHFYAPTNGRHRGRLMARLLTGPNNTADYSDLGVIDPATGELALEGMYAIRGGKVTLPAALARWVAALAFQKANVPDGIEVVASGHCLRCRRLLTVPYPDNPYRLRSLGPECGAGC